MAYLDVDWSKLWAIDVEGDPIPSTKIYLMCCINAATNEKIALRDYDEIYDWIEDRLEEGCQFVAHNGIGYDFPTLNRIIGTNIGINRVIDTNVMSQLFNPGIKPPPEMKTKPHSLKAWGYRIKFKKIDFDDFTSGWSPEMEKYCFRDAEICLRVYKKLAPRMKDKGFKETGLEIEHRAWSMIQKQRNAGFYFNLEEAHHLYNKLRQMEKDIESEVDKFWPPERLMVFRGAKARKADGSFTANYKRHVELYPQVIESNDGGYLCFDDVRFAIGSPNQRREKLVELGWEPREWTDSGLERLKRDPSPLTDEEKRQYAKPTDKGQLVPSLQEFVDKTGNEQVKLIAKWMDINARANMINTWIVACDDKTHCIHGTLYLANTLRYKHSSPNTANIPAVRTAKDSEGNEHPLHGEQGAFTYEARDLWTCRPGPRKLVGVDAKGIQLRVLAHYLNNPSFTEALLNGDPHSYNQEIGGFASRPIAKTFIYAFLLGAGDAKVGEITGGTTRDGKRTKERFIGNFPGLQRLLGNLEQQVERTGRIVLCDGTPVVVSEMHARLGYLLQGDESRIMKKAMDIVFRKVAREKLDVIKVGDIHDEWQNDVHEDHVERFIEICEESFAEAGEFFNYNIPIACDAKVGKTWAETH